MTQVTDLSAIEKVVDEIIAKNPDKVADAKSNPKAIGWFVGQVMKASGGKANPQAVNEAAQAEAWHLSGERGDEFFAPSSRAEPFFVIRNLIAARRSSLRKFRSIDERGSESLSSDSLDSDRNRSARSPRKRLRENFFHMLNRSCFEQLCDAI